MNPQFTEFDELYDRLFDVSNATLKNIAGDLGKMSPCLLTGKLIKASGSIITAYLQKAQIGDLCRIINTDADLTILAEVVAINDNIVTLLPFNSIDGISQECMVYKISDGFSISVGEHLLGKVINGFASIIGNIVEDATVCADNLNPEKNNVSIMSYAPNPLTRPVISEAFHTGVKAIDALITCGKGQRIGIFAGPGMGKTTLLGMLIRNSKADIVVIALVGERGREVNEFIEFELSDPEIAAKCVLVVATSDRPPVEQLKAAYVAQTVAEYFRDQGLDVLLFVDSITRFARAGREVGLSAGEPITRGGYPPSVFLSFPKLMERAGISDKGSITAFYTVLMEGENLNQDPIADEVKSIIDGHIVLTKKLVEVGHFPAISALQSLSRVADRIITQQHMLAARHMRLLLSKHEEVEFLLRVGEYRAGSDELIDEAIEKNSAINAFLKQNSHESVEFNNMLMELQELYGK